MQTNSKIEAKKIKLVTIITTVVLALILGAAGYIGMLSYMRGQSPWDVITGKSPPTVSAVPTDGDGNNLIGNSLENLQSGGLVASQGEDIFYANLEDGGKLYCLDRGGKLTRLTDFAVANLNIRGNALVFTDLSSCSFVNKSGVMSYVSAETHEEVWSAASTTQGISYGGTFYALTGVKDFCEGNISAGEMVLTEADAGGVPYQSPVFAENYLVMLPIRSKSHFYIADMPDSGNAGTKEIKVTQSDDESIRTYIVIGDYAYIEIASDRTWNPYIIKLDLQSGEITGAVPGYSLTAWLDCPVFISDDDNYIYLWEPDTDRFIQISDRKPYGQIYFSSLTADAATGIRYGPSFFILRDGAINNVSGYLQLYLAAVPLSQAERLVPGAGSLAVESLGVVIYTGTDERSEVGIILIPSDDADFEGCSCGLGEDGEPVCECVSHCDCSEECRCIHNAIPQDVGGEKINFRGSIPFTDRIRQTPQIDINSGGGSGGGGNPGKNNEVLESIIPKINEIKNGKDNIVFDNVIDNDSTINDPNPEPNLESNPEPGPDHGQDPASSHDNDDQSVDNHPAPGEAPQSAASDAQQTLVGYYMGTGTETNSMTGKKTEHDVCMRFYDDGSLMCVITSAVGIPYENMKTWLEKENAGKEIRLPEPIKIDEVSSLTSVTPGSGYYEIDDNTVSGYVNRYPRGRRTFSGTINTEGNLSLNIQEATGWEIDIILVKID